MSFLQEYRAVRRLFHNVVQTCVYPEFRFLFAPARAKEARLSKYGVTNHVPCIRATRCVAMTMATQLHRALVGIKNPYTRINETRMTQGTLKCRPGKPSWKGKVPWEQWVHANPMAGLLPGQAERHKSIAIADFCSMECRRSVGQQIHNCALRSAQESHSISFHLACHVCRKPLQVGNRP